MPGEMLEKNDDGAEVRLRRSRSAKRQACRMAYGSDLLGALEDEQSREFQIRGEVDAADRGHPLGDH